MAEPQTHPAAEPAPEDRPKPMLTVEQQVAHMKAKGVTFNLCPEEEAAAYLAHANNYLRAAAYRKLYPKQVEGGRVGQYIGLDFEALRRLSSADRQLRSALREIAIDVEHFARVDLLDRAVAKGEDGHVIVEDYLSGLASADRSRVKGGLGWRGKPGAAHDEYSGDLIAHYGDGYPLWVFLEVIEFGRFCDLWLFCANRWNDRSMLDTHYVLKSVKALRNGVCHNSCLINGLSASAQKTHFSPSSLVAAGLNDHGIRNNRSRRAKMSNLRVAQIAATLYASDALCTTDSAKARHAGQMAQACRALDSVRGLCPADGSLVSFFDFIEKLVDIWTPQRS